MDILHLIDDLEDMFEVSSTIPLTGKVMVDKEEAQHILEQLKRQIPADIQQAEEVNARRDQIISDAEKEANNVIQAAKLEADRLVNEDDLVVEAHHRAADIMKKAEEESTEMREAAYDYVDGMLEQTQVNLSEIIKKINKDRQALS